MKRINRHIFRLFLLAATIIGLVAFSHTETSAGKFVHRGIYLFKTGYQKIASTYNLPFATETVTSPDQDSFYGSIEVAKTKIGENGSIYTNNDFQYLSTGLEDYAYQRFAGEKVIIYDDSGLDENDQQYARQAAQSWNNYLDQHIWTSLSNALKVDENAKASVIVRSVDIISDQAIGNNSLVVGEARLTGYGPVYINILHDKQLTGDRLQIFEHEMGHAMGLEHVELDNPYSKDIMSYGIQGRQISQQNVLDALLIYYGLTN